MAADSYFWVDLQYQQTPRLIATAALPTAEGLLLVDPGPTTAIDGLLDGLSAHGYALEDVHAVLLTHIHLDHAGATGTLVKRHPELQVVVHRIGAPHVHDPSRLLRSARRIYGDAMDRLWGAVAGVPEDNLNVVRGGETLTFAGRVLDVAYTPGHAVHHVSYFDRLSRTAFVGDVAGMRIPEAGYIMPVTPPPDVDVPRWLDSIATVEGWQPETLFLTHCGPSPDPQAHLEVMAERLQAWAAEVEEVVAAPAEETASAVAGAEDPAAAFVDDKLQQMRAAVPAPYQEAYAQFGDPHGSWAGLARYGRKQAEG
ncbi:MAG: MBL fold metallo-hydrolase [Bacteroidetes bacterium]|jgi:glyoxylase-like metal-dependent hydrolase (beta-lactamase superfamily II)|nr:MBL fold metallo-hydrolase [Bacteroidota bacterium]